MHLIMGRCISSQSYKKNMQCLLFFFNHSPSSENVVYDMRKCYNSINRICGTIGYDRSGASSILLLNMILNSLKKGIRRKVLKSSWLI